MLKSAAFSLNAGFGDIERYPTVEEKAARLAYALVGNHAFADGNKCVGILAMLTTSALNGVTLHYTQAELIRPGLNTASKTVRYEEISN